MKLNFKYKCLMGISVLSFTMIMNEYTKAQQTAPMPDFDEMSEPAPEEIYVPREPTKEELKRYEINAAIEAAWHNIFADPFNSELRVAIAKLYIEIKIGEIAEHELLRAEELGAMRPSLMADLGKAYLLQYKYENIFAEVILEEAPTEDHGEIYLIHGRAYLATGKIEQAFTNLYKAERFIDSRLELNSALANVYSQMGEYERAELNVDKALNFDARDTDLLILKGDLIHRKEGVEKSYFYYDKANFYRPDDVGIERKIAGALYSLRKTDESMEILREILSKDSRDGYANFLMASIYAEGNNIRTASRYLNQASFNSYRDFVPGLLLWGKLGYATGDFNRVERALSQLITLVPDHHQARRLLGAALINLNKADAAANVLQYLSDNNMLEGIDYILLGNAHVMAGNNDLGSYFLSEAVKRDLYKISESDKQSISTFERGDNFGVTLNIGSLLNRGSASDQELILSTYKLLADKDYGQAFEKAAQLVNENRRNPMGFNLLGLSYLGQGKVNEASSNFRKAYELDPNFHEARLNLAKIDLIFEDWNAAINKINGILSGDETYIPAYEFLFEMAYADADLIRAERYLLTALSANRGQLAIRQKLFNFYIEQGNVTKARNLSLRMVQDFPDHSSTYKASGQTALLQGKLFEARDALEISLALNGEDMDVYLMLAEVLVRSQQAANARPVLIRGLNFVSDILPLQLALIDLAKEDGNFTSSYLYVEQLKLSEETKALAFICQGELNILQNRGQEAITSFENAVKAGADYDAVLENLDKALTMVRNPEQGG